MLNNAAVQGVVNDAHVYLGLPSGMELLTMLGEDGTHLSNRSIFSPLNWCSKICRQRPHPVLGITALKVESQRLQQARTLDQLVRWQNGQDIPSCRALIRKV